MALKVPRTFYGRRGLYTDDHRLDHFQSIHDISNYLLFAIIKGTTPLGAQIRSWAVANKCFSPIFNLAKKKGLIRGA